MRILTVEVGWYYPTVSTVAMVQRKSELQYLRFWALILCFKRRHYFKSKLVSNGHKVVFYGSDRFYGLFMGFTDGQREFTDDIRVFGQRFLYRHGIELFLFCVFASSLYADLLP